MSLDELVSSNIFRYTSLLRFDFAVKPRSLLWLRFCLSVVCCMDCCPEVRLNEVGGFLCSCELVGSSLLRLHRVRNQRALGLNPKPCSVWVCFKTECQSWNWLKHWNSRLRVLCQVFYCCSRATTCEGVVVGASDEPILPFTGWCDIAMKHWGMKDSDCVVSLILESSTGV